VVLLNSFIIYKSHGYAGDRKVFIKQMSLLFIIFQNTVFNRTPFLIVSRYQINLLLKILYLVSTIPVSTYINRQNFLQYGVHCTAVPESLPVVPGNPRKCQMPGCRKSRRQSCETCSRSVYSDHSHKNITVICQHC
jgi:hypothetical protein